MNKYIIMRILFFNRSDNSNFSLDIKKKIENEVVKIYYW